MSKSMEREVNIWNMLKKVIASWKLILVVALCVGGIGCAAKYVSDMNTYRQTLAIMSEETLLSSLSEEEIEELDELKMEGAALLEKEAYVEKSWRINTDAFAVPVLSIEFLIEDSVSIENINGSKSKVIFYFDSGAMAKDIAETEWNDMTESLLQEIISLDIFMSDSNTFMIQICGISQELNHELADIICEQLTIYKNKNLDVDIVEKQRVEHTKMDYSLYSQQLSVKSNVTKLRTEYDNKFATLSTAEKTYLGCEGEESVVNKPGISIFYFMLFAIVGAMAVVIVKVFFYLISGKIQEESELIKEFDLSKIGQVNLKKEMEDIQKSNEQIAQYKELKEVKGDVSLLVIDKVNSKAYNVAQKLVENDKTLYYTENVVNDIKSLLNLKTIGQVILVVKEDSTNYIEVEEAIKVCKENNIEILGYIYVR